MKQWIIDRYNKGQDKHEVFLKMFTDEEGEKFYELAYGEEFIDCTLINLYDFLFNPEWGFAKAFWRRKKKNLYTKFADKLDGPSWQHHLQQMAIAPDPLEYLEQFKEENK